MNRRKINPIFVSFVLLLFGICSCKNEPPVIPPLVLKDTITVSVEETTPRSIVIRVKTTKNNPESSIEVYRISDSDAITIAEYPITTTDTTINDNGLEINTEYRYFAIRKSATGEKTDTSSFADTKTTEAASLDYTWQEFELGDGEFSNALYDVWGTDENNVYACGSINYNDTLYGIIKWNGSEWQPFSKTAAGVSIIGFSNSDIWTAGGGVYHYNGYGII